MKFTIEENHSGDFIGDLTTFWESDSKQMRCIPEVSQIHELKPYIVRFQNRGHIPVNALVFGIDADDAKNRLLMALKYCAKNHYDQDVAKWGHDSINSRRLLRMIKNGKLSVSVKSYPKERIVNIDWASNAGW